MAPAKRRAGDEEVQALEAALRALEAAVDRLRSAEALVEQQLEEPRERVAMPNSRRAEHQLRTAVNAALGAQRSLRRRLDLRRADRTRAAITSADER
jgi:hypothetical protein